MAKHPLWWTVSDLRDELKQRFLAGERLVDLALWLEGKGYKRYPTATLRRQCNELGWTRANRSPTESRIPDEPPPPGEPASPEDEVAAHVGQRKQQLVSEHHRRVLREQLTAAARWQHLMDLLRETTAAIPMDEIPTPPPAPSNRGDGPARVVAIALSDIQAGIAMDKEEMGERLAYNSTMLSGRFDVFEAAVWRFIDEQALIGPVQCLNFLGVGDWIENHQLRIGARKRTDLTLTQSTIVLQRLLAQFIARTRARYPALPQEWDILPGNHDRIGGGKPGDEMSCDNWAVIIGEMLKLQFRDEPAVRIFVHMEEYAILRLGASRIMLHHGHGIQGTALLPWYGIDRRVSRWEGFHRQQFQYVVLGHFHNPAMWQTTSGCKVYINGAWFDSTAYGASLGLATPAQQTAFAIEAEAGIVYTRELPLSPPLLDTPVSERGFTAA